MKDKPKIIIKDGKEVLDLACDNCGIKEREHYALTKDGRWLCWVCQEIPNIFTPKE